MNSYIATICDEMCQYIDLKPRNIDYLDLNFNDEYTWTDGEEQDFIDWLTFKLIMEEPLRRVLGVDSSDIEACRHGAKCFVLLYGWRVTNKVI